MAPGPSSPPSRRRPPASATLRYSYETPFGSLYPNTPVELGFRLTFDDGRTVDGPTTTILYEDDRFAWKTLEGSIVRVHWYEGNASFGQRALDIGERAIEDASALLGVTETEPVDFYIYADRDKFYDVIGPVAPGERRRARGTRRSGRCSRTSRHRGRRPVGRHRGPARAHAPRVQHRDAATRTTSRCTG